MTANYTTNYMRRRAFSNSIIEHIYNYININCNTKTNKISIYHTFKYVNGYTISYALHELIYTKVVIE
jgi:hypothetical protein